MTRLCALFLVTALTSAVGARPTLAASDTETYTLQNGARVVLIQDDRYPTVSVVVRYHVGARQEAPGKSGVAHLLEHMTFRAPMPSPTSLSFSSTLYTRQALNAGTTFEYTEYYTTMPAGNLPFALWSERWRMSETIRYMEQSDLDHERPIVKNERRQRRETVAHAAGEAKLWAALFPKPHPFHELVIGSMTDIDNIRFEDTSEFLATWYGPANATIVVVGQFKQEEARRLIAAYFGTLQGKPVPAPPPLPKVSIDQETVIRHDESIGETPRLVYAWHSPAMYTPADAAADVAAQILTHLRSARLRHAPEMVRVGAYQQSYAAGSVFRIDAEPRPGVSFDRVRARLDEELAALAAHAPSQRELDRAVRAILRDRVRQIESPLARADATIDAVRLAGSAELWKVTRDRYFAVTAKDVQRFAADVLKKEARVVLLATPTPTTAAASGASR